MYNKYIIYILNIISTLWHVGQPTANTNVIQKMLRI